MREPVARPGDEGVEGVLRVEPAAVLVTVASGEGDHPRGMPPAPLGMEAFHPRGVGALVALVAVGSVEPVGGVDPVGAGGGVLEGGVDRDGQPDVAAERSAERRDEVLADIRLEHLLGVVVGHGDEGGLFDDGHQAGETDEGTLTGGDTGAFQSHEGALPQVGEIDVSACHVWLPSLPTPGPMDRASRRSTLPVIHSSIHRVGTNHRWGKASQPEASSVRGLRGEITPLDGRVAPLNRNDEGGECWVFVAGRRRRRRADPLTVGRKAG